VTVGSSPPSPSESLEEESDSLDEESDSLEEESLFAASLDSAVVWFANDGGGRRYYFF